MDLTKFLSSTLSYGVEPILYFLIFMSLVSVAVIIERFIAFSEIEHKINKLSSIELRLLMEKRLGILATFGNNAPFVGLFGTILGVMNAFAVLGASNTVSTSLVMSGISEALVATAMGLFVAIPSVAAYNYFIRRMRRILLLSEES